MKQLLITTVGIALSFLIGWVAQLLVEKNFFPWIEQKSLRFAQKRTCKYSIVLLEIFFFSVMIFMFALVINNIFHTDNLIYLYLFLFGIAILILAILIRQFRDLYPHLPSLIDKISKKVDMNNYFVNRFVLFWQELGLSFILIIALSISYKFVIWNKTLWADLTLFILMLILPFYSLIWVYWPCKSGNKAEGNMRRFIVYSLLVVFVLHQAYGYFLNCIHPNSFSMSKLEYIFLYVATIVFIAVDRLIKAVYDDYKDFRKIRQK
jgi:hypothetical protein